MVHIVRGGEKRSYLRRVKTGFKTDPLELGRSVAAVLTDPWAGCGALQRLIALLGPAAHELSGASPTPTAHYRVRLREMFVLVREYGPEAVSAALALVICSPRTSGPGWQTNKRLRLKC